MDQVFGISMTSIVTVLVAMLTFCLLTVAWVAWRRPVIFKLGIRNIPRRKAQTTLIVVGLMLSTMIISAALGVGDTVDYSITDEVYQQLGHVDEAVVASRDVNARASAADNVTVDAAALGTVRQALAGDKNVDGIMAVLRVPAPVIDEAKGQSEPSMMLVGLDPAATGQFGGLKDTSGKTIDLAAIPANGVVLSKRAADALNAAVGDTVTIYYNNQPVTRTVAAIGADSYLTGVGRNAQTGKEQAGLAMPLTALQAMTGNQTRISAVLISNAGGVRDSLGPTDAVVTELKTQLVGTNLGVTPLKQDGINAAKTFSSVFTGLFLVLGLFSIAAGVLLIVLIFTMLAAERRSEMGMARAVGAHRRQLIQQFIAEGSGYAILAGMVGAAMGVLAALGIGYAMGWLFGNFISITPHVTVRSIAGAYCLGVVITFLAVTGSSWKISRLNVVAAVRDLPDVESARRRLRTLVWAGLMLLGGGALTLGGLSGSSAFPFYFGMSLLPFGVALVLRFFGVPSRPVFTLVGVYLLALWILGSANKLDAIFGKMHGGIEMFFLSGIFMVIATTIVIMQNTDLLLAGVTRLGGLFRSKLPAVRTAVAYPGAARGRTGMAVAMFSLIIFSLVMMATMNQNYVNLFLGDEANAGWDIRADAQNANPIGDFAGALAAKGVDTSAFKHVGVVTNPTNATSPVRMAGTADWKNYPVRGMNGDFIAASTLKFGQRAEGYATDADVVKALATQPNVAVIDVGAVESGGFGGGDNQFHVQGLTTSEKTFAPVTVELADPRGGAPRQVTIIGVIESKIGSLVGLYANQATIDAVYPTQATTSYFVALKDKAQSAAVAKQIEAALLHNGVQTTSIRDELKDNQKQSTGFLYIIQGFMGLGLLVGVAAIGVIAFRSVVERRQQIGVLRALGYQRSMVSLSFLIETAFVVGLGCLAGTTPGLILSRNLFTSDATAAGAGFLIPWSIILTVLAATVAVALLMTWIPSRQAARIAPAEALRYE